MESTNMTRRITACGPTADGAFVVTTLSQGQLDAIISTKGTAAWMSARDTASLTLLRVTEGAEPVPVATFDLGNPNHQRALRDVLRHGTLSVCASGSVNRRTGMIEGQKLAIDIRPADRRVIETALKDHQGDEAKD